jgi:5-oxoprolinase (ATP-hydrolysing)
MRLLYRLLAMLIYTEVLCAFGDAHTALRHETSCSMLRKLSEIPVDDLRSTASNLQSQASKILTDQGVLSISQHWEVDLRFHGQATTLPVSFVLQDLDAGVTILSDR